MEDGDGYTAIQSGFVGGTQGLGLAQFYRRVVFFRATIRQLAPNDNDSPSLIIVLSLNITWRPEPMMRRCRYINQTIWLKDGVDGRNKCTVILYMFQYIEKSNAGYGICRKASLFQGRTYNMREMSLSLGIESSCWTGLQQDCFKSFLIHSLGHVSVAAPDVHDHSLGRKPFDGGKYALIPVLKPKRGIFQQETMLVAVCGI